MNTSEIISKNIGIRSISEGIETNRKVSTKLELKRAESKATENPDTIKHLAVYNPRF